MKRIEYITGQDYRLMIGLNLLNLRKQLIIVSILVFVCVILIKFNMSGFTEATKNNISIVHHSTSSTIQLCFNEDGFTVADVWIDYSDFKDLVELVEKVKVSEGWLTDTCKHEKIDFVRYACKCTKCGLVMETKY